MWTSSWLLLGKLSNGVWDFVTLLQHPCFMLSWEDFYAFDKLVAWGRGQALMRLQKQIYTTWFPESQFNISFVPSSWKLNTSHMQEAGFRDNRTLEPTSAFASATLRPNPLGLCSFNRCLKRPVVFLLIQGSHWLRAKKSDTSKPLWFQMDFWWPLAWKHSEVRLQYMISYILSARNTMAFLSEKILVLGAGNAKDREGMIE